MARLLGLDLLGVPQRIVQRGNNQLPCFLDDGGGLRYLTLLSEALLFTGVRLHAYVLMDNYVHLLATPPAAGDVGRLMQRLGHQHVGQLNDRRGRTGTLWESRYKDLSRGQASTAVRAARPTSGSVRVSSLSPHPAWLALGCTAADRTVAYRRLLDEAIPEDTLANIRLYLQQQRAWGRDDFRTVVEAKTRRFADIRPAHRPRRSASTDK